MLVLKLPVFSKYNGLIYFCFNRRFTLIKFTQLKSIKTFPFNPKKNAQLVLFYLQFTFLSLLSFSFFFVMYFFTCKIGEITNKVIQQITMKFIQYMIDNNQLVKAKVKMSTVESPVKFRTIGNSLERLNKAASQGRFRIKSMRVKTVQTQQQKCATDRDYQFQLNKKYYSKQFLKSLYITKSQESQLKISDAKYNTFLKFMYQKILNTKSLNLASCNFQRASAEMFFNQFVKLNNDIICYDLSKCTYAAGYDPKLENSWMVQKIITQDKRVVKLVLKNIGFSAVDIKRVLNLVVQTHKIYQLDLSNEGSQSMNRFAQQIDLLFEFFKLNTTTSIVRLDNLSLRKNGVEYIQKGISSNSSNPLKILSLKNNAITEHCSIQISMIVRSGLVSLDLSENPLTPKFYLSLPSWKLNTVRNLDLSATQMNSQALIYFLSKLEQNKFLQNLKLDRNDFSHHWFNQMKQILQINTSLQTISMVDCKIKRLSQTFIGLLHNRYLKKINVSYNHFDEGIKQLSQMIKQNKIITQIKVRACGLKPENFIKIFEALYHNSKINTLDISENNLGQQGAKQILRTLSKNCTLSNLISQKVQIPFQYKEQMEVKIQMNRQIKKKKQLNTLKKQSKIVKQQDNHTWDDVEEIEQKIKTNSKTISNLLAKVGAMEKDYDQKKIRFQEIVKDCNEKQQKLSNDVQSLMKKLKQLEIQQQNIIKKFKLKQQNIKKAVQKQEENIQNLEQQIKDQSIKNQARQNQLQDHYENLKYYQKKNETKKAIEAKKTGFDASTAINSKRKSRNI